MGVSMQEIISDIPERMKSASHSIISAWAYRGEGTSVISVWVYQQGQGTKERTGGIDNDKCQRFPSSSSFPITYIPHCIQTSHFPCIRALFFSPPAIPRLSNY